MKINPLSEDGRYTFVDSFCGAGGVTEGFLRNEKIKAIAAINHSKKAIDCYRKNNPQVQCFEEDFTVFDEKLLPRHVNFFWASAECTHHSNAAGGTSRDADSRSLPEHLERYVVWCNMDYLFVENVKEFLSWGHVIEKRDAEGNIIYKKKGNELKPVMVPDPDRKGELYYKWVEKICSYGYNYQYKLLNSADYGAHTSRVRYFGVFYKKGLPIIWPKQTHAKNPGYTDLLKWNACKEKIDLSNEGVSIFGREYNDSLPKRLRKPLCEATLKRIAYGIKKYFLNDFIAKSYSQGSQWSSLDEPLHTVTTVDRHALIKIEKKHFITQNIQQSVNANSTEEPLPAILTRDEKTVITIEPKQFIDKKYKGELNVQSIEEPLSTIVTKNYDKLVTIKTIQSKNDTIEQEKRQFILTHFGSGVDFLCNAISDIKMRYLSSTELAKITGFPDNMHLGESETERKYHIGNAVPPVVPEFLINSLLQYIQNKQ